MKKFVTIPSEEKETMCFLVRCFGQFQDRILWASLSLNDSFKIYHYDIEAENLRYLADKRVASQAKDLLDLFRRFGNQFYYISIDARGFKLTITF